MLTCVYVLVYSLLMKENLPVTDPATLHKLACLRCGWAWYPRTTKKPETCPKCRSPYWHLPRRIKGEAPPYIGG